MLFMIKDHRVGSPSLDYLCRVKSRHFVKSLKPRCFTEHRSSRNSPSSESLPVRVVQTSLIPRLHENRPPENQQLQLISVSYLQILGGVMTMPLLWYQSRRFGFLKFQPPSSKRLAQLIRLTT